MKFASACVRILTITAACLTSVASVHADGIECPVSRATSDVVAYSHHFYVYYRCEGAWELYECFDKPCDAKKASLTLQRAGYLTKIECE